MGAINVLPRVACAVFCFLACLAPVKGADKKSDVVQIDIGNAAGGYGFEPLEALSQAAAQKPKVKRLRVTWDIIVGSLSSQYTALYDREAGTIKLYGFGGHNSAGNPAQTIHVNCVYRRITDTLLFSATAWQKDQDYGRVSQTKPPFPAAIAQAGGEGGCYDSLFLFGSQRQTL